MNKQEKFLLLVVLLVSGVGATLYVSNQKSNQSNNFVEQVQANVPVSTQTPTTANNTETVPEASQTNNTNTNTGITNTNTGTTNANTNTNTTTSTTVTKSKSVTYQVPEGHMETLTVNVVLKDGVISDVTFSENPSNSESKQYYNHFKNAFSSSSIVGKKPSSVSLSRVGGASLTTGAFNSAIRSL